MDCVIDIGAARALVADQALWPRVRDFLWDFAPSIHSSWIEEFESLKVGKFEGTNSRTLNPSDSQTFKLSNSHTFKRFILSALGIEPCLLYYGLLTGATLGGNITPVGASCNIAGVGMLRKEGHEVSFWDFARIGIPFTLAAVMGGYLFIWFVWR